MAADMRSPNVSVTPINMEPPYPSTPIANCDMPTGEPQRTRSAPHPGLLTNGDVLDSSDAEVAQIDFQCAVNMRHKKKRDGADVPRPMSWEGELSDHERDMCVDDDSGSQVGFLFTQLYSDRPVVVICWNLIFFFFFFVTLQLFFFLIFLQCYCTELFFFDDTILLNRKLLKILFLSSVCPELLTYQS
jgi:hypothetical protein